MAYSVNRHPSLCKSPENWEHVVQITLHPVSTKNANAAAGPSAATEQTCWCSTCCDSPVYKGAALVGRHPLDETILGQDSTNGYSLAARGWMTEKRSGSGGGEEGAVSCQM